MEKKSPITSMVDFQKTFFDSAFNLMNLFRAQGEQMAYMAIDSNPWIPEDGKKVCSYWTEAFQKQMDNYKEFADTNFNKTREAFSGPAK